ncbi:hypothetical protein SAMN05421771_4128 [Granulicella pectinivorans]|uniref:Uncharacterized protein n=1 Tax=Granulicella pectinivorans TaxID=474950 RepID=A0A1I6N0H5_9BACT|nr:hypothetical protein SAMN05421771_4128 [Granulicella pectinivorans]
MSLHSLACGNFGGFSVEGYEDLATETPALVGDKAIGKIAARQKKGSTRLSGRAIKDDVIRLEQRVQLVVPATVMQNCLTRQSGRGGWCDAI